MVKPRPWPPSLWGVDELLGEFPTLKLTPCVSTDLLRITGTLNVNAIDDRGIERVEDTFSVAIDVPDGFPTELPRVQECADRIPADYHTHSDGTLCLGSHIRLRLILAEQPTLPGFVHNCLVPYLFRFVLKKRGHEIDELDHGVRGLLDDYRKLVSAESDDICIALLSLLGVRKRIANKRPCPCGSGFRVGRCHHKDLNRLRPLASRKWYRKHVLLLMQYT